MTGDRLGGLYGADAPEDRQREAFTAGRVPVAVYGLGKMGLPLAAVYAETAGNVTGVDADPDVVERVGAGECHVTGEPGLPELVAEQVEGGRLRATTDGPGAAADASVHVIIVPTLLTDDHEPDLSLIADVAADVGAGLGPGDLVVVESTLPPGTCRDALLPSLEDESGLERGEFGVAFCPERTASGTALRDIRGRYPKVVGGVDEESARAATVIYDELSHNEVHVVSDATTAEAVKIFEGVYRDVNIALANELARVTDDLHISVREAIETANALPVCDLHDPGPGVGGHCIPYYPHFLLAQTDEPMALTRTARTINDGMPGYTVSTLVRELAAGGVDVERASVLVLGVTYRPGVEETRSSPALEIIDRLNDLEAEVFAVDPLVDVTEYGARAAELGDLGSHDFDAAVLVTPHEEFEAIEWEALDQLIVLDGRDELDLRETDHRAYTIGGTSDDPLAIASRGVSESESESKSKPASDGGRRETASHRPDGGDDRIGGGDDV